MSKLVDRIYEMESDLRFLRSLLKHDVEHCEDLTEPTCCGWCGTEPMLGTPMCDCLERRDCIKAGEPGHLLCGPCRRDQWTPRFACAKCVGEATS